MKGVTGSLKGCRVDGNDSDIVEQAGRQVVYCDGSDGSWLLCTDLDAVDADEILERSMARVARLPVKGDGIAGDSKKIYRGSCGNFEA